MKTYQGILLELGQAEVVRRSKTVNYTFIQVADEMIKKVTTFNGLDGKLNNALGKVVTLHVNGRLLVAITTEDGKVYSTEKEGVFNLLKIIIMLGCGIAMTWATHIVLGIPFFALAGYMMLLRSQVNSTADLPNAIEIPR
jgi:predicted DNA-binding protein (UPF0251 family)